ncbi:MAG: Ig-like domain-containing protein [Cyclobacteriaceae bacterium]|nr:Ig-like domain-containing protein [Cyclobacteriaceae bacterium]
MKGKLIALALLGCISCIQVEKKDSVPRDPIITLLAREKLTTTDECGVLTEKGKKGILALQVGEKQSISTEFFNRFGVKEASTIVWIFEKPAVASAVYNEITALAVGTTQIGLSSGGASASISLTVVGDANAIASVVIMLPPTAICAQLPINETVQLSTTAKNINGQNIAGKPFEWFSENSAIVSVSSTGLVTAKANGSAEIHAKAEGVKSNILKFNVGAAAGIRIGTFQSAGGYSTVGSVTVEESGGKLVVKLSSDFRASIALGTFIYLANSTAGGNVKSAGLDLGAWSIGNNDFDALGVTLNQYKFVVVLCKPAGLTFGFAELKP